MVEDKNKKTDEKSNNKLDVKVSDRTESKNIKTKDDKSSISDKVGSKDSPVNEDKKTEKVSEKKSTQSLKKELTVEQSNKQVLNKSKTLVGSKKPDSQKTKQSTKNNDSKESKKNLNNNLSSNSNANSRNEEQNEFIEKLVSINRVAKVVKGGRRFSFAALVVVGDGNGMVGHGKGKAKEVPEAIKKATDEAKAKMIRVPLKQGKTLHHDIKGRFDSGKVYLRSAPSGTGVIAGGPMRAVFEALGIQDIVAKSVGSSNPHNMVRATFEALSLASSPKIIAMRRGLKINDITKRRKLTDGGENVKN
tara:strand:- start:372 stop:1286 length:915 start_codon:yes stop_codon:yes gene_type:complete